MTVTCTVTGYTDFGFAGLPVPEAYAVPGHANLFTTPQLEAVGLGYKAWWEPYPYWGCYCWHRTHHLTSVTQAIPPIRPFGWAAYYGATLQSEAQVHVQFYKIGPIQNTDGATLPANITTNLINLGMMDEYGNVGASHLYTWTTNTFVSKVRACTPLVDQTVHFGQITFSSAPALNTVLSRRDFSLTFTCPYLAYTQIGYSFVPKYGSINPTVMALEPGAGIAKGVGIRIRRISSGQYNHIVTFNDTYYISEFNLPSTALSSPSPRGPSALQRWQQVHANPTPQPSGPRGGALLDEQTKNITFRTELVRAGTEPFAPGSVKSVVWIYIKYK